VPEFYFNFPTRIKIKGLFLWLLILLSTHTNAQFQSTEASLSLKLDSIEKLKPSLKKDTLYISTLSDLILYLKDNKTAQEKIALLEEKTSGSSWMKGHSLYLRTKGYRLLSGGSYYEGIDLLNKALVYAEDKNDLPIQAFCYRYLGASYYILEENKKAIDYYSKALNAYKKLNAPKDYYVVLSNVALCRINMGQYPQAISDLSRAIKLATDKNDTLSLGWFYGNLGIAQSKSGAFSEAQESLHKSVTLLQPSKSYVNIALAQNELSIILRQTDNWAESYKMAILALNNAESDQGQIKQMVLDNLYEIYKIQGNYYKALEILETANALKFKNDSIIKRKSLDGLQALYDNKKKETDLIKQKNRNLWLIGGSAFLAILFSLAIISRNQIKRKSDLISQQKTEIETINTRLEQLNKGLEEKVEFRTQALQNAIYEIQDSLLQGQILERGRVASLLHNNLGGVITSIKFQMQAINVETLSEKEKSIFEKVYEQVSSIYEQVREISHEMTPGEVGVKSLFENLSKHISYINATEKIRIVMEADPSIDFEKRTEGELFSIFVEVINNIIKYADARNVRITISKKENSVNIIITDDGRGFNESASPGFGLKNIEEKVKLMYGKVTILSLPQQGTTLSVILPGFV